MMQDGLDKDRRTDRPQQGRDGLRPRMGMLTVSLDDAYTSTLIRGVAGFAESAGLDLLLYVVGQRDPHEQEQSAYRIVQPEMLDGIVLTGGLAYRGPGAWEELMAFRDRCLATAGGGLPLAGTSLWLEGVPAVVPSSYEGMREAVEHLIDVHGYRRIGFIGGPEPSREARERYRAYTDALHARGIEVNPNWLTSGDFTQDGGVKAATTYLTRVRDTRSRGEKNSSALRLPFDALVCASDGMAIGAMDVFQAQGIRVPEDLAIVGFDDSEDASRLTIPLTTVRQPVYAIGYRAAAVLWQMIQGGRSTPVSIAEEDLVVPTRMVVRRSCGCLPEHVTQAVLAPSEAGEAFATPPVTSVMLDDLRAEIVAELVTQAGLAAGGDTLKSTELVNSDSGTDGLPRRDDSAVPVALVDAFWAELHAETPPAVTRQIGAARSVTDMTTNRPYSAEIRDSLFVRTLAAFMRADNPEAERWDWHALISALRRKVVPLLGERHLSSRAEDLLQQARGFIGEALTQAEAHRHSEVEALEAQIRNLTDAMAHLEDLGLALERMEQELPSLSVHAHCMVRTVQPEDATGPDRGEVGDWEGASGPSPVLARLERARAYDLALDEPQDSFPGEGGVYPLAELLPHATWRALAMRRRVWIILPLSSGGQSLGMSLFHGAFEYPATYLRLRQALIGVVLRSSLVQAQVQARLEAEDAMRRAEVALRDALIAQQRYVSQAWVDPTLGRTFGRSGVLRGYERSSDGEGRTEDAWLPAMTQAMAAGHTIVERDEEGETLALPLFLYGQEVIGTLGFWRPLDPSGTVHQPWSDGQIRLVENVVDQMAQALETQRLLSDSRRRAARMAAAAEVSSAATSMTDLRQLLSEAVTLIRDRFALYYAGLFMVDQNRAWAVLVAGTGEAGALMVERGHRLDVGGTSMIGRCVASGQAQIVSDTTSLTAGSEVLWRANPLLPDTRSELALPLLSRGAVIGAMTIQDSRPGAFTEGDVTTLQTMADQLANAIANARLLEEMERTLREVQLATGRYTQETWREFMRERSGPLGYRYRLVDVTAAGDPRPEVVAAMEQDKVVTVHETGQREAPSSETPSSETQAPGTTGDQMPAAAALATTGIGVPIRLRNQILGALNLQFQGDTVTPEVLRMVEQVAERLAVSLESARLLEESRRTAERERLVGDVSRRIRQSLEVDEVLQSSVREIRDAMDLFKVSVRMAPRSDEE